MSDWPPLNPSLVAALPKNPYPGQEVYYLADATNGVLWHFRYLSTATGSYRWMFIDGSELYVRKETSSAGPTAANTMVNLDLTNLKITVPFAGDYDCELGGRIFSGTGGGNIWLHAQDGSAVIGEGDAVKLNNPGSSADEVVGAKKVRLTGIAANADLRLCAHTDTVRASSSITYAWLAVRPVRVSG